MNVMLYAARDSAAQTHVKRGGEPFFLGFGERTAQLFLLRECDEGLFAKTLDEYFASLQDCGETQCVLYKCITAAA